MIAARRLRVREIRTESAVRVVKWLKTDSKNGGESSHGRGCSCTSAPKRPWAIELLT